MKLAIAAALLACTGCDLVTDSFVTNDFSGDVYPIAVETTSGAIVVGLRPEDSPDRTAVLDLLSPITLVDPGAGVSPSVTTSDLIVLGLRPTGELDLPRAQFPDAQVLALHMCVDDTCNVGPTSAPRPFDAIIGADALAGDAVRMRLGDNELFVLADVAGDAEDRAAACDAVFPSPYRGGGTLVVAGTELGFTGRRVTMQTCLGPDPDPALPQSQRGADALMLISTGIGTSLIGQTAYERYVVAHPLTAIPFEDLATTGEVFLPSGPVAGRVAMIAGLALVARSSTTPRAPCRHVYGHHLLLADDCKDGDDCPCENGDAFCPIPAVLELPNMIEMLVIPDDNPTLQALRTELRPDQPEVDGIIGTNALRTSELDIDYPNARVLARCTTPECVARPAMPAREDRLPIENCLLAGPIPRR
ncbi:MAG: hypothetical protein ABI867_12270 [Kofleriaceae bacterium]